MIRDESEHATPIALWLFSTMGGAFLVVTVQDPGPLGIVFTPLFVLGALYDAVQLQKHIGWWNP